MMPTPSHKVFQSGEKGIFSRKLNRSVAVQSSFAKFSYVDCVSIIFDIAMTTANSVQLWPKINLFDIVLHFFPFSLTNSRNSPICTFYKHPGLILS